MPLLKAFLQLEIRSKKYITHGWLRRGSTHTQLADQDLFLPSRLFTFPLGLRISFYDKLMEDRGCWKACPSLWSINEPNRPLTYDGPLASILNQACNLTKRATQTKWIYCEDGDWSLGHANPAKLQPRDVAS